MWYVMQVVSGQEKRTVLLTEKMISAGILENCFVPMRRRTKKFHGIWYDITEKLFPGYVFLITRQPQLLYEELKRIPVLTRMLGRCEEYFVPLSEGDVRIMKKLCDGFGESGKPEVEMSEIIVEAGNRIRVLSGPLVNLEGQIKKVNLHKRTAAVEIEFMGRKTVVYLGVEIVKKMDCGK